MQRPPNTQESFDTFAAILQGQGVRESLVYLVGLTDYRFIGIWRFRNGRANAAVHYDRENPTCLHAQEVPDTATHCCYVRNSKGVFMTANALLDPRTADHPARETVPAYCGIPLMDEVGEILGTLCHYDVVPRPLEAVNLELLLQVASALAQGGHVPPYPTDSPD